MFVVCTYSFLEACYFRLVDFLKYSLVISFVILCLETQLFSVVMAERQLVNFDETNEVRCHILMYTS